MKPPARALYWACAGDIVAWRPERGGEVIDIETAARLHAFHLEGARASRPAEAGFHAARERELRGAIRACADWRRAAFCPAHSRAGGNPGVFVAALRTPAARKD